MHSKKGHLFERLSFETIGACIEVQRQLGVHCKEVDYQRALTLALPERRLRFQLEVEIPVIYNGVVITRRRADFIVGDGNNELLLEIKARSAILPQDIEQCLLVTVQPPAAWRLKSRLGMAKPACAGYWKSPQGDFAHSRRGFNRQPEQLRLLYLHQGGYRLCLLVNFGEKPLGIRRLVHTPKANE